MNKLTKVGFSALCGSLAAITAANAGGLTVTGGVDMSWISLEKETTGNPIGIGSNLTFKGSGELDNGWTFNLAVAHKNGNAYSAAVVDLTMGGLGTLTLNQGDSSTGISAYDNKMPTAWEEPWGNGLSTGVKTVLGVGGSGNVQYKSPTILGVTLTAAYAPQVGAGLDIADKGSGGASSTKGKGMDGVININPSLGTEILSGLNIFAGGHYTDRQKNSSAYDHNLYEAVAGITYDIGPISLGYGQDGWINGVGTTATAVSHYRGEMYGVAFNINDNLSVSYGFHSTRKAGYVNCSQACASPDNRLVEVESVQIAYTMGGASIRVAETEGKNLHFSSGNDKDATVVSLGLAF